jgi:hypothetical protein
MRSSGERKAIEGEDEQEPRGEDQTTGTEGDPSAPSSNRPYTIWLKVESSKRHLAPVPDHLSRPSWVRLSRQIVAFLRSRLNNSATLRAAVRRTAAEMRLAGASADDVVAALRRAVLEHPELATLDRTNMVTRRLASEELLDRMLEWAQELAPPDSTDGNSQPG